jgi:hypothetical protein
MKKIETVELYRGKGGYKCIHIYHTKIKEIEQY